MRLVDLAFLAVCAEWSWSLAALVAISDCLRTPLNLDLFDCRDAAVSISNFRFRPSDDDDGRVVVLVPIQGL